MDLTSINWKPTPKALREFGAVLLIGLGIIGLLSFWRGHHGVAYGLWAFGIFSGGICLTGSKIARPLYWAWMSIGFVAGNVIGRALIVVFFYGVIGGMGLVMKLIRRDRLVLRKPDATTYWCDCPVVSDVEHYQRQS